MQPTFWIAFGIGAGGAAAAEMLKLYQYAGKMTQKKYTTLVRAPLFWAVVIGMIVASGFVTWVLFMTAPTVEPIQLLATGIGCRSIVRELAATKAANAPRTLGGSAEDGPPTAKDIFL